MNQSECRALVQSLAARQVLAECEESAAKRRERQARKYAGVLQPGTLTKTVARKISGEYRDTESVPVVVPESARAFNAHYDRCQRQAEARVIRLRDAEPSLEEIIGNALEALIGG